MKRRWRRERNFKFMKKKKNVSMLALGLLVGSTILAAGAEAATPEQDEEIQRWGHEYNRQYDLTHGYLNQAAPVRRPVVMQQNVPQQQVRQQPQMTREQMVALQQQRAMQQQRLQSRQQVPQQRQQVQQVPQQQLSPAQVAELQRRQAKQQKQNLPQLSQNNGQMYLQQPTQNGIAIRVPVKQQKNKLVQPVKQQAPKQKVQTAQQQRNVQFAQQQAVQKQAVPQRQAVQQQPVRKQQIPVQNRQLTKADWMGLESTTSSAERDRRMQEAAQEYNRMFDLRYAR